jgi:succinyl-diaminopimelate desuccinylase
VSLTATEEILKNLVQFQTVTGDFKANNMALDYIADFLQQRGMYIKKHEWDRYRSLIATVRPDQKTPAIMLYSHIDVVPCQTQMWKMQKKDGKIFGRGVFDMKFSLAIYMQLVDELKTKLTKYDFGIMVLTDEETGGGHGICHLIEEGYVPKVCIMPDGGENWQIEIYAKGVWHFQIETWGESSHGSRPWQGNNAVSKMITVLHEIETLFMYGQRPDTSTFNIGYIKGGEAINQVPDYTIAGLDIRYTTDEEGEAIKIKIETMCKRRGAKLTAVEEGTTIVTDLSNPYIQAFIKSAKNISGISLRPCKSYGASDARYFAQVNVPCIISSPLGGDRHSNHEWIDAKGIDQYKDILQDYLQIKRPLKLNL